MRFYSWKALSHRESYPLLVRICLTTSSASVGVIRQLVFQIPRLDEILIGYWMAGHVRTMVNSVMYKSKLKMGEKSLGGTSWCHVGCSWGTTWGFTGALLCLEVLRVELVALGTHFDNCGSICAPVWGILVSLGIDVELGQKAWTSLWSLISRMLDLNYFARVRFLLLYPLLGGLVLPTLLGEVLVRPPWSSGLCRTHWPLPERCSLHHQYYFPSLVLFPTPHFVYFSIQVGKYLM